ncbi:uncharacterized protein Dana_GF13477, isoform D [Drosophila ananassae]|uniref:Uncharacterized protein, isoform D n=1 Tax=Drosophila ananassae TaxID=7217 RepID=A0A0P8YD27_DROAN|nr:uncharacterized protein Dana_GF13477, isoform D [Drosophila ananassae]
MNISTLKEVKFIVKMWKHFSILAAMLYLLPSASGYNYCHNKSHVCRQRNLDHFMCNLGNLRPLDGTVKYEDIMPDAPKLRDNILGKLNRYRNNLAGGDIRTAYNKSFPKASRMRALAWDEELGYLARCHAKTVSFMHSECRATSRFPYAGEVLAMIGVQKKKLFLWEIINLTLKPMFEEHMLVEDPEEYVKNYDPIKHYGVGHFTTLISDRVSRVGCGIAVGSNCNRGTKVGPEILLPSAILGVLSTVIIFGTCAKMKVYCSRCTTINRITITRMTITITDLSKGSPRKR